MGVRSHPIRIVLDLEVVDNSPVGNATTRDGPSRRFEGWLGLLAALEAMFPDSDQTDKGSER